MGGVNNIHLLTLCFEEHQTHLTNHTILMKKLVLPLLALIVAFAANAALTALHIHTASQGVITVLLDNEPTLTFNDDRSVTIESTGDNTLPPVQLDFDDIESCEYGDADDYTPSSINSTADDDTVPAITVRIDASGATFANLPDNATIEIYGINGALVRTATPGTDTYSIDRSSLQRGVYIVRIGQFITKLSL